MWQEKWRQFLRYCGCVQGEEAYIGPRRVEVYLTNKCNLNCIACWSFSPLLEGRHLPPAEELEWSKAKELLSELADSGCKEILLVGGGEPMVYPRIMEALELIKSLGMSCFITTNMTPVNSNRARMLVELGVDRLYVSLWAATPETYSRTHPNASGRTFENIRKRLAEIRDTKGRSGLGKPEIIIHNVIFSMNYQEIGAMVELAVEVGASAVQFTTLYAFPGSTDVLLLDERMKREVLRQLESLPSEIFEREGLHGSGSFLWEVDSFMRRLEEKASSKGTYDASALMNLPCQLGWFYSIIGANGNVIPCCKGQDLPMGNVYEESFGKIWHSVKYREFRRMGKSELKTHPYFRPMKCLKMCDNIGMLRRIEEEVSRRKWAEPLVRKIFAPMLRAVAPSKTVHSAEKQDSEE